VNSSSLSPPRLASTLVQCDVAGYAALALTAERFAVLRRNTRPTVRQPISPGLLKHSDHQTVAGLAAVLQAIHAHGLANVDFGEWGAIAGPCLLGRQACADSILRFREEGAFAISPHVIPHESLHAVSGTISQALGLHGTNFGVGGGLSAADEAVLVAATLLSENSLPGLWLILTGFAPEMIPLDEEEAPSAERRGADTSSPWICHAVVLALMPRGSRRGLGIELAISGLEESGD